MHTEPPAPLAGGSRPARATPGGDSRGPRSALVWPVAAAAFVVAFVAAHVLTSRARAPRAPAPPPVAAAPERPKPPPPLTAPPPPLTPDAIFARTSPAVVKVEVDRVAGSGFLVNADGLVATNYHVIARGSRARVVLADNRRLAVLGVAAVNAEADVALLKVAGGINARPLELAEGGLPPVGSKVYAVGNPLGLFANTLSDGLVSAHRRTGTVPLFPRMPTMIQTTAPISHGSSGGPLLAADGKVVGVTTLSFADLGGQNVNLAVPASEVARLLLLAEADGRVTPLPLSPRLASGLPGAAFDDWPPEDVENAAVFTGALRAASDAFALCRARGREGRPWLLAPADRQEFVYLMDKANRDAGRVREDVLKRMHASLPDAVEDFIAGTRCIAFNVVARRPDPRGEAAWARWLAWWQANGPDVRAPAEAMR